ncbi:MAG TPA: hypothetical protein VFS12_03780, partial [Terriglobia bacterium]|nr:hypothetical protein [Terriglobia bacterium]
MSRPPASLHWQRREIQNQGSSVLSFVSPIELTTLTGSSNPGKWCVESRNAPYWWLGAWDGY